MNRDILNILENFKKVKSVSFICINQCKRNLTKEGITKEEIKKTKQCLKLATKIYDFVKEY